MPVSPLQNLPEEIKDFLGSEDIVMLNESVSDQYGLDDRITDLIKLTNNVFLKNIGLAELPKRAKEIFNFSDEQTKKFVVDISNKYLLAFDSYFDSKVPVLIQKLGGKVEEVKVTTSKSSTSSIDSLVKVIMDEVIPQIVVDEILKKRLQNIIISFSRGVRVEFEVREKLTDSVKIGGMGMTEAQADRALEIMQEFKSQEQENTRTQEQENNRTIEQKNAKPLIEIQKPKVVLDLPKREEVLEIAQKSTEDASAEIITKQDKVEKVLTPKPGSLAELDFKKRVESFRLKMPAAEAGITNYELRITNKKPIVKAPIIPVQAPAAPKVPEIPKVPAIQKQMPATPSTSSGQAVIKPAVSPDDFNPSTVPPKADQPGAGNFNQKQILRPSFTQSARPKMEDIKFKPRLIGPIEELKNLTLADFRRLSPVNSARRDKIFAKFKLLENESIEKRAQGVAAWRESEVYGLYINLGKMAMTQNKSVYDIMKSSPAGSLTAEEFKTIMEVNRGLRF